MALDPANTLTPEDLEAATRAELLEYISHINDAAKRMTRDHLAWPMRHAQLNAAISEVERRDAMRILTAP